MSCCAVRFVIGPSCCLSTAVPFNICRSEELQLANGWFLVVAGHCAPNSQWRDLMLSAIVMNFLGWSSRRCGCFVAGGLTCGICMCRVTDKRHAAQDPKGRCQMWGINVEPTTVHGGNGLDSNSST